MEQLGYRFILPEIDVLVLDVAPESLGEDIVHHAAATVLADFDAGKGPGRRRRFRATHPCVRERPGLLPFPADCSV